MKNNKLRVAIGLSGGVDSSVAAALLKERGYDVVGVTMTNFDPSRPGGSAEKHGCYGPNEEEEVDTAADVCKRLHIPFHVIDLRKEFGTHVIDYFRKEYLAGRTPNPCAVCNQRLKFGLLLDKVKEAGIGFQFFATGHYAQITKSDDSFLLKRAADLSKDQTYFLYRLTAGQLSHTLFPIGRYTKEQVRQIARSLGLETAEQPESQDFISGKDHASLFGKEETQGGDIVDEDGNILGKHRGIVHYTVGQRRGLGIASDRPLYVVSIDARKNTIVASDKAKLFSKGLVATSLNLPPTVKLDRPYKVKAKIRLKHEPAHSTLFPYQDNKAVILFDEPQMSVTPGQSVVLYTGDIVFGGGTIKQPL